ncbi:anti-repressor SinI family protein [Salibacterium halotolerans]|uniref:Anti-repressor SinI n=1 Tax=Salibacterium halotolerans TaxID=1884432 RepID=A0A1I5QFX9_9BACI|nr:anti-repressor SinI family protein [Salibacterium halotolerans]SFP45209.1 Anti-repressor SinI [Salibacterium halotolerans]
MSRTQYHSPLDEEWVELMKTAKEAGITKEEVQQFLQQNSAPRRGSRETTAR